MHDFQKTVTKEIRNSTTFIWANLTVMLDLRYFVSFFLFGINATLLKVVVVQFKCAIARFYCTYNNFKTYCKHSN